MSLTPVLPLDSQLFECDYGRQPPLFSALVKEVAVPSAPALVFCCHVDWKKARVSLLCVNLGYQKATNRLRSPAPQ